MSPQQLRLVGYLSWVDDEDLTKTELAFLERLTNNRDMPLTAMEDLDLRRLHYLKGY